MTSRHQADPDRYSTMRYRRCGRSGLDLPALSLGLWQNFGHGRPFETQRAILLRAFDLGITHIDLANNYGPPPGAAEQVFGRVMAHDLAEHRDELVVASKAGYGMWPGPYGDGGSRKYLLASLDQTLARTGLDYVDVFYHHRPDPSVPLEETMGALHTAVTSGRALYAGVSNYSPAQTRDAAGVLAGLGTPLVVHQPSYSMFNRHVELPQPGEGGGVGDSLLDVVGDLGVGTVVFSPLAQGLLTDRYLGGGIPTGSRASDGSLDPRRIDEQYLARARALQDVATGRGQTLAQLALTWVLRDDRITSAVVGASSVAQLEESVDALGAAPLGDDEMSLVEQHAIDGTAH